jgi:hypothetical protein
MVYFVIANFASAMQRSPRAEFLSAKGIFLVDRGMGMSSGGVARLFVWVSSTAEPVLARPIMPIAVSGPKVARAFYRGHQNLNDYMQTM